MTHPTLDWSQLNDRFYRKIELYSMQWKNIDISKYVVAAAPNGGAIALVRDDKQLLRVNRATLKPDIFVFTASGRLTATIPWEKGRIVGLSWTESEHIVCVVENGEIVTFDVNGEFIASFMLDDEVRASGVLDCRFYSTGVVIMTNAYHLYAVTNIDDPRTRQLPDIPGLAEIPRSWTVIEPRLSTSRALEVLVAVGSTVFVVDGLQASDMMYSGGPYTQMAVSPNGKLLALFSEHKTLNVVTSDFKKNFSEIRTHLDTPTQLVWCGTDSVVGYWDRLIVMFGPSRDVISYPYDDHAVLVPEFDAVRILSNATHELLQRVPDVIVDTFKIGSTAPSATLYDALEHFEKKSPKSDDLIRSLRTDLKQAVATCIAAAAQEYLAASQQTLLRAASFGKCFADNYDPKEFVDMCRTLRVLNALRYYEIGIPLTYVQFERLTPEVVIDRLIARHQHLVAFRICEYLGMRTERVLVHWACTKVRQPEDDGVLCDAIVAKLAEARGGISYALIAKAALSRGKPGLAIKLLEHEPCAGDQVPLLVDMKEYELALRKAVDSGDTDLVYFVLLHIKDKLPRKEFLRIVHKTPAARDLFIVYARDRDVGMLRDLYYQDDRKFETANVTIADAYTKASVIERATLMKMAMADYAESKEHAAIAKAVEDQIKLMELQKELEGQLRRRFLGLSVSDTIYSLILAKGDKRSLDIKKDFRVPDRRYWWLKIRATAELGDWTELDRFADTKKSPIGYEPFVDVCMQKNQTKEAVKYVKRMPQEERIPVYVRIGAFEEAVETAFQLRDDDALNEIRNRAKNRKDIAALVENKKAQLATRR